jgi:hypothetical protein
MPSSLLSLATGGSASIIARQENSQCAHWCAANFPTSPGSSCTSLAAHEQWPCYDCDPAAKHPGTRILCNRQCVDSEVNNCGICGNVVRSPWVRIWIISTTANVMFSMLQCATGALCSSGTCLCPTGENVCSGACVNENTDINICGGCGTVVRIPPNC